jgi:hypothetical protein
VTPVDIGTAVVRTRHIRDGEVRGIDTRNNSIESIDIKDESLTGDDILDESLTGDDIANDTLTSDDIGPGAVGNSELANSAVDSTKVQDNSLFNFDIANEAGADFSSSLDTEVVLTGADVTVRSVVVTAPSFGAVIVNASGYFRFSGVSIGRCSITTGAVLDFTHLIIAGGNVAVTFTPFAATRGFVVGAGSTTFNLVCNEFSGDVNVGDATITAIFVPTFY